MTTISLAIQAARAALQWRLLLLWSGALLLPTIVLALPVWFMLGASLDHSVHAPALAQQLDLTAIADLMGEHGKHAMAFKLATLIALAVTLLLSPLLSGMVSTAARASGPARMRELFAGGVAEYPRMFRMLVWAAAPLAAALAIGNALRDWADAASATALLPTDGAYAAAAAAIVSALLLVLALATLDAGRAMLAVDRRRTSAVAAWWLGVKLMVRRPGATLGAYVALSAAGLGLAALLGLARVHLPHVDAAGFIAALALTQVIALVLAWMRSARLFALIALAQR